MARGKADPNPGLLSVPLKLMLLSHLLGDIHQPLHMDLHDDFGGNVYYVTFLGNSTCWGSRCNIHKVWDSMMMDHVITQKYGTRSFNETGDDPREAKMAAYIKTKMELMFNYTDGVAPREVATPSKWSATTLLMGSMAYLNPMGFNVDDRYISLAMPLVERQIYVAGYALAASLNFIFDNDGTTCEYCTFWHDLCTPQADWQLPESC